MKMLGNERDSLESHIANEYDIIRIEADLKTDTHNVSYADPISKEKRTFGCGSRVSVKLVEGNIVLKDLFDGTTKILPPGSVVYAD